MPQSFVYVPQAMNKAKAVAFIRHCADAKLPTQDCERFVEVVETQLLSLHLGGIARHRLRPSEFDAWQTVWRRHGAPYQRLTAAPIQQVSPTVHHA